MRLRWVLMLAIAAAAVIASWSWPESAAPSRDPLIPVSSMTSCIAQYSAPPSYGTRALSHGCAR